jgi:CheY-like chemotaxis protein
MELYITGTGRIIPLNIHTAHQSELALDAERICRNVFNGNKEGFEIFDEFLDLFGGTILNNPLSDFRPYCLTTELDRNDLISLNSKDSRTKKTYNWKEKTILIAEDEESNFLYLKAALIRTEAKILWAKTGKDAVDIFQATDRIDLILMDIRMPLMNGIEATQKIMALNSNIKIIAQTAYIMEEDKREYFKAGCIDYLAKPINRDLLLSTVAKYI